MRQALLAGLVSLGGTSLTAPVVRRMLVHRGSLDVPNDRSSHATPVPRGGGLACLSGVALGTVVAGRAARIPPRVLTGVAGLAVIGLVDDQLGHVHYAARLAAQAAAGIAFSPGGPVMTCVAPVATAGVVNVVNFMDGINGISGSTAAVWGLSALMAGREVEDPALQTLGAVTVGAGLGFLPWNVPRAQLFLGDVGSYLLGGLMAAGMAQAARAPALAWRVAAPLLPYGLDAAQALLRRARRRARLTDAHREHVYQRLVHEHGMSHVAVSSVHVCAAGAIAAATRSDRPGVRTTVPLVLGMSYIGLPNLIRYAEAVLR